MSEDKDWIAFRDSLPDSHWAKYDLSAVYLGWEAANNRKAERINDMNDMSNLQEALEFYDKVRASNLEDRVAVGRDHIDWLVQEARIALAKIEELESCMETPRIEDLQRIEELENALRSLSDDEWWDMETPTTAADFAAKALKGK